MKKTCSICNKEYDGKVKQKYCCVTCQHEAAKKPKNPRVTMTCMNCEKQFITMVGFKSKNKKYCSRACKDEHQKTKYLGDGNPMAGKEVTESTRKLHSIAAKKAWKNPEHKSKVQAGQKLFVDINGYWPGTDDHSKNKRRQTFLTKYGVDHNWKNKDIREKCDITTISRYGKSIGEMGRDALLSRGHTSIESTIAQLLSKHNIPFKRNYYIYFNDREYKVYDFYLTQHRLLIEADGDYWHANPKYYLELNEIQHINVKNDQFKNELAKNEGIFLLRFWEEEIHKNDFETVLLKAIQEHGKG